MTKLLVSVRDAREAETALAGGADWIDLKEPRLGPLGAVDLPAACAASDRVAAKVLMSAAAGELIDWPHAAARRLLDIEGVRFLKLGLAGCAQALWSANWIDAQRQIRSKSAELIAVAYADAAAANAPQPEEILELAVAAGSPWLLIDTFSKSGGSIVDRIDPTRLSALLSCARRSEMKTAVAGSLKIPAIKRLPLDLIDMIAVRGAACRWGRESAVDEGRVRLLRRTIDDRDFVAAGVRDR